MSARRSSYGISRSPGSGGTRPDSLDRRCSAALVLLLSVATVSVAASTTILRLPEAASARIPRAP